MPAPHWPIPGVDAGNTAPPSPGPNGLIDAAWSWGSLAWSPDGTTLAAAAQSQEVGEGQIHLFDRTGQPIGALPGWESVWIDNQDLMTLERNADGASNSAWLWSTDARTSALVDPAAIDLLTNAVDAVAITEWSNASQLQTSFRVWNDQGLSEASPGRPAAWSADGEAIAVLHDAGTAVVPTSSGVIFASGGPRPTWLEVLDGSTRRQLAAFPRDPFDPRTFVLFDPSGNFVATNGFVFDVAGGVALGLPAHDEAVAWTTDDKLIVASRADHTLAPWDPATHAIGRAYEPGTRLPISDGQLLTVPPRTGDLPLQLVTLGISPDGALRAWYPLGGGNGSTPLWLVPVSSATP